MTTTQEALQMALDALEVTEPTLNDRRCNPERWEQHQAAIAAIEAALAEPKQEPESVEEALAQHFFADNPDIALMAFQWWRTYRSAPTPEPALVAAARAALKMVDDQAEDEGLWFIAQYASEGYLQQELRRLHATVEALRKALP